MYIPRLSRCMRWDKTKVWQRSIHEQYGQIWAGMHTLKKWVSNGNRILLCLRMSTAYWLFKKNQEGLHWIKTIATATVNFGYVHQFLMAWSKRREIRCLSNFGREVTALELTSQSVLIAEWLEIVQEIAKLNWIMRVIQQHAQCVRCFTRYLQQSRASRKKKLVQKKGFYNLIKWSENCFWSSAQNKGKLARIGKLHKGHG